MPFTRPTLAELIDRTATDMETALPGVDARLRRSNMAVLAKVHAGAIHGLYGYLDWLSRQLMVDTADGEYLDRYASIWGLLRVPAGFASGPVVLNGSTGAVVPVGAVLQRGDGQAFETLADATLVGGTATVNVSAVEAGASGNTLAGSPLTLVQPVASVLSVAAAGTGGLVGGADVESDAALRARLLLRLRTPPMGGSASDYVAWALRVPGVTRAWCFPLELGVGTVVVRFLREGDASPIPDAGEVAAVQSYINSVKPVTAQCTVMAPVAVPLDLSITLTPNTVAVQNNVRAELADLLSREASPGGTILISHLREAISVAAGETNHVLTVPTGDVSHAVSEIAVLGTITWS